MPTSAHHALASQTDCKAGLALGQNIQILPPILQPAFSPGQSAELPLDRLSRGKKQFYSARPARSCLPLTRWIVANHKSTDAASSTQLIRRFPQSLHSLYPNSRLEKLAVREPCNQEAPILDSFGCAGRTVRSVLRRKCCAGNSKK